MACKCLPLHASHRRSLNAVLVDSWACNWAGEPAIAEVPAVWIHPPGKPCFHSRTLSTGHRANHDLISPFASQLVLRARGVLWSFFSTASGQTDNLFLKHLYDLDLVPARDPRNSMRAVRGTYKLSCDESRSAAFVICSMFSSCSKFFDSPDHTFWWSVTSITHQ